MSRERVLITVKTYPTLSQSHVELVCTAGFRENGSWVRIYPVPFRLMERGQQFAKWTWVELPLARRTKDQRPESFSPVDRDDITILDRIGTEDGWRARREWVLGRSRVSKSMADLIDAAKRDEQSLATYKPARMISLEWKKVPETAEELAKVAAVEEQLRQRDFLDSSAETEDFRPARRVPYEFSYRFLDEAGKERKLRILDWEIGMLYWRSLDSTDGDEDAALELVKRRYETEFFARDLHLFLGTTYEWHKRAPNPWVVIGVFPLPHPPPQMELF